MAIFVAEESRKDDKMVSMVKCQFPEIPVGGRLSLFYKEWKKLTDDNWVLSIIKEGYKLEFQAKPPKTGVKQTFAPAKSLDFLNTEVKD